jgi:HK97 family phage portal protein
VSWLSRLMAFMPGRHSSGDGTETVRIIRLTPPVSGQNVDADTALKNAATWACVTWLSKTVAQLPWRVLQESADGKAPRRVPRHPVDWLIHRRPNPEMGSFTFRETMVGWAVRRGNAVAEIQTDARSVPTALWPIHPTRVKFDRDDNGALVFVVKDDYGNERVLRSDQVFHLRGFGEGAVGLDVISYAADSIGWAQATEIFGSTFFGNGAHHSGALYVPGKMSPAAKAALEAEVRQKWAGANKAHGTPVLDGGIKWEKASVDPNDAQFIETRQHQVEEICRWFGVPPHKVMHLLRATFSNIEHQSIEVVVDSVTPWAMRFEQEADHKLFGQNRQGFYTKLDIKGLLRGDFKSRQEGLQIMRRNGVINANDWCRLEDMDEIGPDGDKYIVEGNMTTLAAVGTLPALGQEPAGEPQEESAVERARKQAARAFALKEWTP